jgi:hypothetical protein
VSDIPFIDPHAVYTIATLTDALGLRPGTLPRECRLRRLRFAKRAGRVLILSSWVLAWIEGGEVRRPAAVNGRQGQQPPTLP